MSNNLPTRREILRQIETGRFSAAEGLRLIERLPRGTTRPVTEAPDLLYFRSVWEKTDTRPRRDVRDARHILVFDDDGAVCGQFREWPGSGRAESARITLVRPGARYTRSDDGAYEIDPESEDDYRSLFEDLLARDAAPGVILHLWSRAGHTFEGGELDCALARGFYSIFLCGKALVGLKLKERIDLLYLYQGGEDNVRPEHAGVGGFARTLRREHPNLLCRTVAVANSDAGECAAVIARELSNGDEASEVCYRGDERYVKRYRPVAPPAAVQGPPVFREGGVYLITGGAGALGMKFAEHISGQVKARLVLAGRSEPGAEAAARINQLNAAGAEAGYLRADVSRREEVERLVSEIRSRFGALNGIIHCAGLTRDSLLMKKSRAEVAAVLAPKVYGTLWLDELTSGERLDFFALFSSVAATFGSVGQCDYAYANGFVDGFAEWRDSLRAEGRRSGRTLSINWPLWQEGGMTVDERAQAAMREAGVEPLGTRDGLRAFRDGLALPGPRLVVLCGRRKSLERLMEINGASAVADRGQQSMPGEQEKTGLREKAEIYLKEVLAREVKIPASKIRPHEPLEKLGIDSLLIMALTQELEKHFGELPKTLFFECQTLAEVTDYFVEHHGAALERLTSGVAHAPAVKSKPAGAEKARTAPVVRRFAASQSSGAVADQVRTEEIAVVGVGGRYPMADDLAQFWGNLKAGKDCVTEIPEGRWDHGRYFSADKKAAGKSYSKWGAFLEDVDKFDPLFFNISPAEAELIDPQERLFLETVWQTVEDAGYTRERLSRSRTGVFVGVMYGHYQLFSAEDSSEGGLVYGSSFASIANRVSYVFNFRGPSIALDTMCSSSLTAIHLACKSILTGECELAVAGGVNVTIHPQKYQLLSQGRFAASDGRCRSFGEGGDGYVPGEGVGAVLLKTLRQAVADGDHIYGVIRGSAINHGGKTNGYTVPNPKAQEELIAGALKLAKLDPSLVSYVEAHGTGTSLGDPIEIAGLTRAFRAGEGGRREASRRCAIGSVKSNIGHLESAAGIAAVTKVLLQFKHRQLVPSLHSRQTNPNINFAETPFYVQQELAEWEPPAVSENGEERRLPRAAGVSGFGAGGANAHLILQEFLDGAAPTEVSGEQPQIVVLSAKNQERLKEYAARYLRFLGGAGEGVAGGGRRGEESGGRVRRELLALASALVNLTEEEIEPDESLGEFGFDRVSFSKLAEQIGQKYNCEIDPSVFSEHSSVAALARHVTEHYPSAGTHETDAQDEAGDGAFPHLADLAYTLQVGREAMRERLAIVASGRRELCEKLRRFCQGDAEVERLYAGSFVPGASTPERLVEGRAGGEFIRLLVEDREMDKLAQLWVSGVEIDWHQLHEQAGDGGRPPRRIPLPTYPFARERYWVPAAKRLADRHDGPHQLVEQNISTRDEGRFAPRLAAAEPHPADDGGRGISPAREQEAAAHVLPLRQRVEKELQQLAAVLIKVNPEQLEVDAGLGDFGFESVTFIELGERINQLYGIELLPTVFFERDTVRGLGEYLLKEFSEQVQAHYANRHEAPRGTTAETTGGMGDAAEAEQPVPPSQRQDAAARVTRRPDAAAAERGREAVAVIGMSGVFPGSKDLDEFWENLRDEKDLIGEIPAERWNWRDYHADFSGGAFNTRAKWGGFIEDADKFDARFFNISPLEAEMMDPQQRVFLETVWKTIEDGGYRASEFAGRRVGLFVGVQFSDYQQMLASEGQLNPQMGLGNEHSILVNRVSYLLNLRGPSEPYNTACSSALVAVHRAVNSIRSGESELAVAGGISLMLSPYTTISGDSLGVLSPEGRCKTLDAGADGYVRGEGVGALLLKPLSRALADGDHVYAVIRGTAVNHGGKAPSLTAPNSEAQAALLVQAYEDAGFGPESVSYLELHGTGTKLGDPIEIEGIKSAFKQLAARRGQAISRTQYCGVGSVKTNIGHLEPASGIAGIIKLILSMRHKTLPGLLHLRELNPYVKLGQTPFYVVDRTRPWEQLRDSGGASLLRRAGVSSFGFGGVNAHIVIEEHETSHRGSNEDAEATPQLIVLSAKNEERLVAYAEKLRLFLARETTPHAASLADIAYTLQIGREEFAERVAFVASGVEELREGLSRFLEGRTQARGCYRGKAKKRNTDEVSEAERARVGGLVGSRDLDRLAEHWVSGGSVDWRLLYAGDEPRRTPLPTYPFERKRYWALKGAAPVITLKAAPAQAQARPAATTHAEDTDDAILKELRAIFAEELKTEVDGLEPDTDFAEFGVDSILASVIVQHIRERYGEAITLSAVIEYPTLRELAAYVEAEGEHEEAAPAPRVIAVTRPQAGAHARSASKLPPELVPLNLKGGRQPSFWVHGGVGYAALYTNLSRALGPDYPFYAFQARGVDGKSIPHDFEEMIAHYTHCIRLARPEGPYVIGGYSYGGLVAYEIARRMHLQGDTIAHLVLFDTLPSVEEALSIFSAQYGNDDNFLTMMMGNEFAGSKKAGRALITMEDIERVPEKLRVGHVAKLARERGQNAMSADEMYNYIRGSIKLCDYTEATYRTYRAEPYDGSDVLYFKAEKFLAEGNWIGTEAHDIFRHYDYTGVWRQLTRKNLQVVHLPGDHFNMLEDPALPTSVEHVRAALDARDGEGRQSLVA